MHTKNCLARQGLAQKASQTYFGNTSVQQNIVESINNCFLDFQWLAKVPISPYYNYYYIPVSKGYKKLRVCCMLKLN